MTITILPPSTSSRSLSTHTAVRSPLTSASPRHSSPLAGKPVPIPQKTTPRRPSSSTSTPSPRSFLVGSYPLSLLHSRLGPASPPRDFTLRIRAISTSSSSPSMSSAQPLSLPFKANFYDHDGPSSSPWVADVDLEHHYFTSMPLESAYPGYRVPSVGQLQLVISGPQGPVHAFIVPYDLSTVPVNGRMLARERTYSDGNGLRYAVQLQFVCCGGDEEESDDSSPGSSSGSRTPNRQKEHYLARQLKLVFTASKGDDSLHSEREDEVVPPSPFSSSPSSASAFRHRRRSSFEASAEWSRMRRAQTSPKDQAKAKARAKAEARGFVPKGERPRSPAPPAKGTSLLSALAPSSRRDEGERERRASPKSQGREKVRPGIGRTDTDTELSLKLRGLDIADVV